MTDFVRVDRHWCLTGEGDRVVPETDPAARFLLWAPGDEVPRVEAERRGALGEKPRRGRPPAAKRRTPDANK